MKPYLGHKRCNKEDDSFREIETDPELNLKQILVGETQNTISLLFKNQWAKNYQEKEGKKVLQRKIGIAGREKDPRTREWRQRIKSQRQTNGLAMNFIIPFYRKIVFFLAFFFPTPQFRQSQWKFLSLFHRKKCSLSLSPILIFLLYSKFLKKRKEYNPKSVTFSQENDTAEMNWDEWIRIN